MPKSRNLYMIDLFAGCGGLSLGMEQAGFHPILFSELSESAAATYTANRVGRTILGCPDIHDLTNEKLHSLMAEWRKAEITKDVDLICGGPPCQGYSGIGHRRSHKVERRDIPSNHLYEDMSRVIRQVRPKIFLFENVKGLLTGRWTADGQKGEIWEDVCKEFYSIPGYTAASAIVQSAKYGVPQNRPRVLLVGIRSDLGFTPKANQGDAVARGLLPRGTSEAPDLIDVLDDLIDKRYPRILETSHYPKEAYSEYQVEMRRSRDGKEIASREALLTQHAYSRHSTRVQERFRHIREGTLIPKRLRTRKFAQRVLPRTWDGKPPNITVTSLPDDFVHWAQDRSLTVREWARLQCFPDWYQFEGPRTTGGHRRAGRPHEGNWDREVPRYTQIGNAVPVRLAHAIGQHFAKVLRRAWDRS